MGGFVDGGRETGKCEAEVRRFPVNGDEHKMAVRRCVESLEHACLCNYGDAECALFSSRCANMKKVLEHERKCSRRLNGNCTICKQLMALCIYHAKDCGQVDCCPVPYCDSINHKLCQTTPTRTRPHPNFLTLLKQRKQSIQIQNSIAKYRAIYSPRKRNQSVGHSVSAAMSLPTEKSLPSWEKYAEQNSNEREARDFGEDVEGKENHSGVVGGEGKR